MKNSHKILLTIILFFIVLFINNNVFAGTEIVVNDYLTITLSDEISSYKYIYFTNYPSRAYNVIVSNDAPLFINDNFNGTDFSGSSVYTNVEGATFYYKQFYNTAVSNFATLSISDMTEVISSVNSYYNPDGFFGVVYGNSYFSKDATPLYSTFNVYNLSNVLLFEGTIPATKYPEIYNSVNILSTGNFDYVRINSRDFVGDDFKDFYLCTYDHENLTSENEQTSYAHFVKSILITKGNTSSYYSSYNEDNGYVYMVPASALGLRFENGKTYNLKLGFKEYRDVIGIEEPLEIYDTFFDVQFTVGGLTAADIEHNAQDNLNNKLDEQTNAIKDQTEAIKEQTQTSKNIFQQIIELPGKLVNLLMDGLKALFIPDNEFFSDWFIDLNDTFSDQFGILYYPVDVILEFLGELEPELTEHDPIIHIPTFEFEFFSNKIVFFNETNYNLNDILDNEQFEKVHNYYYLFINIIFTIGLISFASKIATEIFGGIDDSVNTAIYDSQADTRAYNSYSRSRFVREKYKHDAVRNTQSHSTYVGKRRN